MICENKHLILLLLEPKMPPDDLDRVLRPKPDDLLIMVKSDSNHDKTNEDDIFLEPSG